jgi:hypothetical protein
MPRRGEERPDIDDEAKERMAAMSGRYRLPLGNFLGDQWQGHRQVGTPTH